MHRYPFPLSFLPSLSKQKGLNNKSQSDRTSSPSTPSLKHSYSKPNTPSTMHLQLIFTLLTTLTTILALPAPEPDLTTTSTLVTRAACDTHACITYFSDGGCIGGLALGSYRPDCSGACFRYSSFSSIRIMGNTVTGADCVAYSDSNCQSKIRDSGNQHNTYCLDNVSGLTFLALFFSF